MRRTGAWTGAVAALLSEMAALGVLAWWGATVPEAAALRVLLGAGLPAAAAVLWGLFAAPRAVVRARALLVVTKLAVLGGAVAALADLAGLVPAAVLAVVSAAGALLSDPAALQPPVRDAAAARAR
ncbi:DUF2568 domain-containing protein [Geodermatophilus sp. URMC 62]|uniref:DUF2568 domain-containing protein n=1 Tax=Geodermatophilus sp. URMC 62 TaxID=3423414 RepID=UPI00406D1B72